MTRQQHKDLVQAGGAGADWDQQRKCGKVKFPSKKAAKGRAAALGFVARNGREPWYRCPICKSYHVGHA